MSGAKQPDCLCQICKFDRNGNCVANPKTDWCVKALLPRTVQAAPSDRERRMVAVIIAAKDLLYGVYGEEHAPMGKTAKEKALYDAIAHYEALAAVPDKTASFPCDSCRHKDLRLDTGCAAEPGKDDCPKPQYAALEPEPWGGPDGEEAHDTHA